jgi:hypothetical protein
MQLLVDNEIERERERQRERQREREREKCAFLKFPGRVRSPF